MEVVPSTVYNNNKMPMGGFFFWREEGGGHYGRGMREGEHKKRA